MLSTNILKRRYWPLPLTLLLLLALVVGCVPISPVAPDVAGGTVPIEAPAAEAQTDPLAGDWTGAIAIAGIELGFDLHVVPDGEGYAATLDIPEQGAMDLPVTVTEMTRSSVNFSILDGPNLATFTGALADDGSITGAFSQAGMEGTFALTRVMSDAADSTGPLSAGVSAIFEDPSGLWSVPIPTGWIVTENDGFVTLSVPDEAIAIHLTARAGDDAAMAVAEMWEQIVPGFNFPIDQTFTPPSGEGIESTLVYTYDADDDSHIVQAAAQTFDGLHYISLFDVGLEDGQRRSAQISIVDAGFKILGAERADLSGVQPAPLTDEIVLEWESFIDEAMVAFEVPGAAVGVVRGGELVYAQGFGIADPATETPFTPETHAMIGSVGKSLSTMLMGTLIDDGLMTWDTTAQSLYPDFAVMDPSLSESITIRNLVCACTGVPRRDLEFIMNADSMSASDVIASLQTFEFFTGFGEAFQYSNQMVATGGYIAGVTAEPEMREPFAAYTEALRERVTAPIGMENTTLSFDEVRARGNYATPHSYNALGEYVPVSLAVEEIMLPIAPAGSHWSTLVDMAKYMVTQLSVGVSPEGVRVISEENLLITREPQIEASAEVYYGLGWLIGDYKKQPMIEHGGNSLGFTADFAFLPDADLGIIVLTNAQASSFNGLARIRLLELLFDQPSQVLPALAFSITQAEESLASVRESLDVELDVAAVTPFVGHFTNAILGDLIVTLEDGELFGDFGELASRIAPRNDDAGEPDGYVLFDPPLAGSALRLEVDDAGTPQIIIGEGVVEYTFTPVTP